MHNGKVISRAEYALNKSINKNKKKVTFIDTMNYAQLSVEKLGKLINIPKMKSPSCLGTIPKTKKDMDDLIAYNINDAKVSKLALKKLFESFILLGGVPKPTIASQAMNIFKAKYLKGEYAVFSDEILYEQFLSYYGGRTEAFARGKLNKNDEYKLYDINSLYPFCMLKKMPDPNSLRITHKNTLDYINNYEGVSYVSIFCPYMEYPLLPYRTKSKLLFPIGEFKGWYTHIELRKAIEIGYVIKKVHKTHYFNEVCYPFTSFVNDLYSMRRSYPSTDPMHYVCKIVMNSLYGKFGQKFVDKETLIHKNNITFEDINNFDKIEELNGFMRCVKSKTEPSNFCFPIWASYISAYGRLELYKWITQSHAIYCDTDSVITKKKLITGEKLGDMKLESVINTGYIIKPKFYLLNNEKVKIKGVRSIRSCYDFIKVLSNPIVTDKTFCKFKEAIRRGKIPNEIITKIKHLSLEDTKRQWKGTFNKDILEFSKPLNSTIIIENELIERKINLLLDKPIYVKSE